MEKDGPDVYSASQDPPTVTSTFQLETGTLNSQGPVMSELCGMGWKFEFEVQASGHIPKLNVYLHPHLCNFSVLKSVNVDILLMPVFPIAPRTFESSNETSSWPRTSQGPERKSIYRCAIVPGQRLTLALSVSFPDFTFPNYPAPSPTASIASRVRTLLQKTLESASEFQDVQFVLFSRRVRGREIGVPKVLWANSELLAGTNEYIDTLLSGAFREGLLANTSKHFSEASVSADTFGYDSDSDLESEWAEDGEADSEAASKLEVAAANNDTLRLPPLSKEVKQASQASKDEREQKTLENTGECRYRTIYIHGTAAQTWKVFLYYLYTGEIQFKPLSSLKQDGTAMQMQSVNSWACSPKSMYRLADKIGMDGLKELCKEGIRMNLTEKNIIVEMSSKFTSRYEEIQKMEVDILLEKYLRSQNTRKELIDTLQSALRGGYSHAHDVLMLVIENKVT